MRVLVWVQYRGTDFFGFQKQKDRRTVAGELEKGLSKLFNRETKIYGCARTDAKAHAVCHPVAFDIYKPFSERKIVDGLNAWLPEDVRVCEVKIVESDFLPLREAVARTYVYLILKTPENQVFLKDASFYAGFDIDEEAISRIEECLRVFEGEHDFSAFAKSGSSSRTKTRFIYEARVVDNKNLLAVVFTGSGFLYGQIRSMVSACLEYARNKISLEDIEFALKSGEKVLKLKPVPAVGLYLYQVWFKNRNLNFKPDFPFMDVKLPDERTIYAF